MKQRVRPRHRIGRTGRHRDSRVRQLAAARLFALATARLGLNQWKASVQEKLRTLNDTYRFAVEQTSMARGEFLELVVVVILVLELAPLVTGAMRL